MLNVLECMHVPFELYLEFHCLGCQKFLGANHACPPAPQFLSPTVVHYLLHGHVEGNGQQLEKGTVEQVDITKNLLTSRYSLLLRRCTLCTEVCLSVDV